MGIGAFSVVSPALAIQKISQVMSDPVNGTSSPKRIPGSVARYTLTIANTGAGAIDASSLVITDPLPADVELCVTATCGGVVNFADGASASGVTFSYAANVSYSSALNGGAPFTYSPSPTPEGYDATIRGIRIALAGSMNGATSSGNPSFTIRFLVRVR